MTLCKLRIFFLGFFIIISSLYSLAQNKKADSLKRLLSAATADTTRVFYMYKISDAYSLTEVPLAMKYADDALALAKKLKYKKGEARSHTRRGNIFVATALYDTALAEHLISLQLCEEMKDYAGIAAARNNIALMYLSRSLDDDYEKAIENYKLAKRSYEKLKDSANLTTVLVNIGDGFEKMKKLDSAFIYSNMAKRIAEKRQDYENLGVIYFNLGSVSYKSGKIEEALKDLRAGIYYMTTIKDHQSLSTAWSTLAACFKKLNKIDSFEFYANKAIYMGDSTFNHTAVFDAANQLSEHYDEVKDYPCYYEYKEIATKKDSIISDKKRIVRIEQLKKLEELRQAEKRAAALARKHGVQKVIIAGFIFTLFIALIILKKRKADPKAIKALSVVCLALVFEFVTFIIHSFIDKITHEPIFMVMILATVATLLGKLHHKFAHWLEKKLIHNKGINHFQKDRQPVPSGSIHHEKPLEKNEEKQEKIPGDIHQKTTTDLDALPDKKKLNVKMEEKHPPQLKPDQRNKSEK